jgi:hypothetical protein
MYPTSPAGSVRPAEPCHDPLVLEHDWEEEQLATCQRLGVEPVPAPPRLKFGVSANLSATDVWPINALRHKPEGQTSGWYIWRGGEIEHADDFFQPLHGAHLLTWCPAVIPYLQLPPGWRLQLAPGHEDTWEDVALLKTE